MRDWKKITTTDILAPRFGSGPQWEQRYDRVAIWTMDVFQTKLDYIHNNPVKAGLADVPEGWYWSSAADYVNDREGPVPVWKEWWS
ncbi:hypothetical protein KQI63_04695 [bacterium]|nr:hypothetical protein [bacterium]